MDKVSATGVVRNLLEVSSKRDGTASEPIAAASGASIKELPNGFHDLTISREDVKRFDPTSFRLEDQDLKFNEKLVRMLILKAIQEQFDSGNRGEWGNKLKIKYPLNLADLFSDKFSRQFGSAGIFGFKLNKSDYRYDGSYSYEQSLIRLMLSYAESPLVQKALEKLSDRELLNEDSVCVRNEFPIANFIEQDENRSLDIAKAIFTSKEISSILIKQEALSVIINKAYGTGPRYYWNSNAAKTILSQLDKSHPREILEAIFKLKAQNTNLAKYSHEDKIASLVNNYFEIEKNRRVFLDTLRGLGTTESSERHKFNDRYNNFGRHSEDLSRMKRTINWLYSEYSQTENLAQEKLYRIDRNTQVVPEMAETIKTLVKLVEEVSSDQKLTIELCKELLAGLAVLLAEPPKTRQGLLTKLRELYDNIENKIEKFSDKALDIEAGVFKEIAKVIERFDDI